MAIAFGKGHLTEVMLWEVEEGENIWLSRYSTESMENWLHPIRDSRGGWDGGVRRNRLDW